MGVTSKLTTVNFNPVAAFRVSEKLSLGGGFQFAYGKARLTNAITTTTGEGFIDAEADDFGFGWTIGALLEPWRGTRLGVSYRSMIAHQLEGDATITPGVGAPINVDAKSGLPLPETVRLGFSQDLGRKWGIHLGATWRRWSRFDERRINFDAPVGILAGATSLSVKTDWSNSWYLSAGFTYEPSENWVLRAGIGYDETPVPDATRGPAIPGADGMNFSIGASYKVSDMVDVSAGYVAVFGDDVAVNITNPGTGNLTASYQGDLHILGIQGKIRF